MVDLRLDFRPLDAWASALSWASIATAVMVFGGRAAAETVVSVGSTTPLPTIITTTATLSRRALIDGIQGGLKVATAMEVQAAPQAQISGCGGDLVCLLRTLSRSKERFALLVGVVPTRGGDLVTLELIDQVGASVLLEESSRSARLRLRAQLSKLAVVGGPLRAVVKTQAELSKVVRRQVEGAWRRALEREGQLDKFGEVLVSAPPQSEVRLAHRSVVTEDGKVRFKRVRPGVRAVGIRAPGRQLNRLQVEVKRGAVQELVFEGAPKNRFAVAREVTFWSGVGLATVGAVLVGVALALPKSGGICILGTNNDACGEFRFKRIGGPEPPEFGPIPKRGLPILPFAYSLVLTGATASLSTWAFEDNARVPWLPIALSLVAGGVSMGLSLALEP